MTTLSKARARFAAAMVAGAGALGAMLTTTAVLGGIDPERELAPIVALVLTPYLGTLDVAYQWLIEPAPASGGDRPASRRAARVAIGSALAYAALGVVFLILKGRGLVTLSLQQTLFGLSTGFVLLLLNASLRKLEA